jgi:predicted nucleic acid-binding protein
VAEAPAVNTSPLLYLARAGLLELLRLAGDEIVVPEPVAEEVRSWRTADAAVRALETHAWLRIVPAEPVPATVAAWDLGRGESSVLAWGLSHRGAELILDDLSARRCAATLGLPVRGTLGLVLIARRRGLIRSARAALDQLRDAGMYLSEGTAQSAPRRVGE